VSAAPVVQSHLGQVTDGTLKGAVVVCAQSGEQRGKYNHQRYCDARIEKRRERDVAPRFQPRERKKDQKR